MLCFNCLEMLEMWSLKAGALQNLGLLEEADSEADGNRFYRFFWRFSWLPGSIICLRLESLKQAVLKEIQESEMTSDCASGIFTS